MTHLKYNMRKAYKIRRIARQLVCAGLGSWQPVLCCWGITYLYPYCTMLGSLISLAKSLQKGSVGLDWSWTPILPWQHLHCRAYIKTKILHHQRSAYYIVRQGLNCGVLWQADCHLAFIAAGVLHLQNKWWLSLHAYIMSLPVTIVLNKHFTIPQSDKHWLGLGKLAHQTLCHFAHCPAAAWQLKLAKLSHYCQTMLLSLLSPY